MAVSRATLVGVPTTLEGTRPVGRFWWDRARPIDADLCPLRAVIFDLDALADIECGGHRVAFNAAFAAHGLDIAWDVDRYRRLLKIPDEHRRLVADLRSRGFGRSSDALAVRLHRTKTALFEDSILDADVAPRAGLADLLMSLFVAGVWAAVVTPGRRAWVQPLVRQLVGDGLVETIVTSDDLNSADDSVHTLALWELGIKPEGALAISGSAAGLRAAAAHGLPTVAITAYRGAPGYRGAASLRTTYDGADPLLVTSCARLHKSWWTAQLRSAA